MRKNIGSEVALLCLPIALLIAGGFIAKSKSHDNSLHAVRIDRWVSDSGPTNYIRVHLTLQWNRSWLDRSTGLPLHCHSWLLDADGHVVVTQNGYGFNPVPGTRNQWVFDPDLYPSTIFKPRGFVKPWKEPLTFQGIVQIDNSEPLIFNLLVPKAFHEEKPRPSTLPYHK